MKIDLVWFGTLVAVVLQTAFLSPPVAMSAYYLKQVVQDWSLATIYGGMFQFMIIQVICVALLVAFPPIATWFPETLQEAARSQKIPDEHQKILDRQRQAPSLEEDALEVADRMRRDMRRVAGRRPRRYEYPPCHAQAGPETRAVIKDIRTFRWPVW